MRRLLPAAVVLSTLAVAPPADAAKRPARDLRVPAVTGAPVAAAPGAPLALTISVADRSPRTSSTTIAVTLVPAKGTALKLVTGRVVAVTRRRGRLSLRVAVPATTPPGAYRLTVCADADAKVKERSERNNCRSVPLRIDAAATITPAPGLPFTPKPQAASPAPAAQAASKSTPPAKKDDAAPAPGPGAGDPTTPPTPTCTPTGADRPDAAFVDADCDGFDGAVADAVHVATTGQDEAGCGAQASPCATIRQGVERASATDRSEVFVAGGSYPRFDALSGVAVTGGFGTNWQRDPALAVGSRSVTVGAALVPALEAPIAVRVLNAATEVRLADLTIVGGDATAAGQSTYAVHALNSKLRLERVQIVAGDAADGAAGVNGESAGTVAAPLFGGGGDGADAGAPNATCDAATRAAGGSAGVQLKPLAPTDPKRGGEGGAGGKRDTSCFLVSNVLLCAAEGCLATAGSGGEKGRRSNAEVTDGGAAGTGGSLCSTPGDGKDGAVTNGDAGAGGNVGLADINGAWLSFPGSPGGVGASGAGGGGGGGSGGCDTAPGSFGAGGGGGGTGGDPAEGGGTGGKGGGGSFGVLARGGTLTVADSSIERGDGGDGGAGGSGGRGQAGAEGGEGGSAAGGSKAGGDGGDGGHGGHGGGGGGGFGGPSIGIYTAGTTRTVTATTITGGSAGAGGLGGASAPTAPVALRDGNPGDAGSAGTLGTTVTQVNIVIPLPGGGP